MYFEVSGELLFRFSSLIKFLMKQAILSFKQSTFKLSLRFQVPDIGIQKQTVYLFSLQF